MDINPEPEDTKDFSVFWTKTLHGKALKIEIENERLIDFCSKVLGYYNYVDGYGNFILVKLRQKTIVEETRIEEIKQEIKHYLRNVKEEESVWAEFVKKNRISEHFVHLLEKLPQVDFNFSTKDEGYFFYQNGAAKVTKDGFQLIPYENFHKIVWKQQINQRVFNPKFACYRNSIFQEFLFNVCNKSEIRYHSLCSLIGYILHPYKDPALSKAVILLDERVDFSGLAHGGTGKSLIAKGIENVTSIVWKDGKKYNANEVFVYDDIRAHHRVLYFDDVKRDFNFEYFFSLVTGNLQVKRKFKDSILIPFSLAPKLLISSNYMVKGNGGDTDERRRLEFEVSTYYSKSFTPMDEFKHRFFDDWDLEEWQLFDHFMLSLVSYYLRNGIITPPSINLIENKLKVHTDPEFVVYMDYTIQPDIHYDKAQLIEEFKELCPSHRNLSAITFKKWVDIWAEYRGYLANHFKSNGRALVIMQKQEE